MTWLAAVVGAILIVGSILHWFWYEPMGYHPPFWTRVSSAIAALYGSWVIFRTIWGVFSGS